MKILYNHIYIIIFTNKKLLSKRIYFSGVTIDVDISINTSRPEPRQDIQQGRFSRSGRTH